MDVARVSLDLVKSVFQVAIVRRRLARRELLGICFTQPPIPETFFPRVPCG
jgi:hypothetical protein